MLNVQIHGYVHEKLEIIVYSENQTC